MDGGRGRRWLVAALAATAATIVSAAAAPGVGAGPESSIVFSANEAGVTVISSSGSSGQSIRVDFGADRPPLPTKFVIEVPTGYTLDLTGSPGTRIADGAISILGVDAPSFATGFGSLVAKEPKDFLSDPAAQACAPGAHAAVWSFSTSIAGQKVDLTIFVDPGRQADVGYVLQACPTGLATTNTDSVASISLAGFDVLASPTTPGDYRWRALVTPQGRKGYELQALVPLPESVTLNVRYDRKRKIAAASGTVIEGGKTIPHALVVLNSSRNGNPLDFWVARTDAQGQFSVKAHITATTDFTTSVATSAGPCTAPATTPAGCLGSNTAPPDDAFASVWLSVPSGAIRKIHGADQRRAEKEGLAAADLPRGFETSLAGGDPCLNPKHESTLTITGESTSPAFYQLNQGEKPSITQASGLTRVYATSGQAQQAYQHQARVPTVRCSLTELGTTPRPIKPLRLPAGRARIKAFRAKFAVDPEISANYDVVFFQRGRSVTILTFVFLSAPDDLERELTLKLAERMR